MTTSYSTSAFPEIVVGTQSSSAVLLLDSDVIIKFDSIGSLPTLLATNRTIIITPEVFNEVVTRALANPNPAVQASGQRIASWISQSGIGVQQSDPTRPVETGSGAGERSLLAD